MPYKRFSPAAYAFLVTDFDSVFRRIDFFNTHKANALIELFRAICLFGKLPNNRLSSNIAH